MIKGQHIVIETMAESITGRIVEIQSDGGLIVAPDPDQGFGETELIHTWEDQDGVWIDGAP